MSGAPLSAQPPEPLACALFIIAAFVLAGVSQTIWFRTRISRRLAIPLDGGATLSGRRVLGDHKTLRGFVVMVPAASVAFLLLQQLLTSSHSSWGEGIWQLTPGQYAQVGLVGGLGFMLGELPNSFLKRRLGIPPGRRPAKLVGRILFATFDRLDSILGMLLAISLVVPTPWQVWAYVCSIGPAFHGSFSYVMSRLRLKTVPA